MCSDLISMIMYHPFSPRSISVFRSKVQCLLLFCLPLSLSAQHNKLLGDDDIIWAAEVETMLVLDNLCGAVNDMDCTPLKLLQTETSNPSYVPFTQALIQEMYDGTWPAFADASLSRPLSAQKARASFIIVDTVLVFDPETYEESMHVVRSDWREITRLFKTRQLWFFNASTGQFGTRALAIAPVLSLPEDQTIYTPVWYQLPAPHKKGYDLTGKRVQLASSVSYSTEEAQMKEVKGSAPIFKNTLIDGIKAGRIAAYDDRQRISTGEVPDLFFARDTIFTIDPETYEENFEVVEQEYRAEDITAYAVQQNWFFDPKNGRLQCQPESMGPAVPVTNQDGTLAYYRALFFWRRP